MRQSRKISITLAEWIIVELDKDKTYNRSNIISQYVTAGLEARGDIEPEKVYDENGFDEDGFDRDGYNKYHLNRKGFVRGGGNISGGERLDEFDKDGYPIGAIIDTDMTP